MTFPDLMRSFCLLVGALYLVQPAKSQYLASEDGLRAWRFKTKAKVLDMILDPYADNGVHLIACTHRDRGICGGECVNYVGPMNDACSKNPGWLSNHIQGVQCLASTTPVQMCQEGCQEGCIDYSSCQGDRTMDDGFCYIPGLNSIQRKLESASSSPPLNPSLSSTNDAPNASTTSSSRFTMGDPSGGTVTTSSASSRSEGSTKGSRTEEIHSKPSGQEVHAGSVSLQLAASPTTSPWAPGDVGLSGPTSVYYPEANGTAGYPGDQGKPGDHERSQRLSIGAILGITLGSLLLVFVAILLLFCYRKHRSRREAMLFDPSAMERPRTTTPLNIQANPSFAEPASQETKYTSRGHSFSTWTATVKLPEFGYQKSVKSRPNSVAASFRSAESTVVLHDSTETKRVVS